MVSSGMIPPILEMNPYLAAGTSVDGVLCSHRTFGATRILINLRTRIITARYK